LLTLDLELKMQSHKIFAAALDICDPWYIKEVTFDKTTKQLDIHLDFHRGSKFPSGIEGDQDEYSVYDTTLKSWRHLSFFEHEAYLHCRTPRIKLSDGRSKIVSPPWAGKAHGFTLLFEAMLVRLCEEMPVATVSEIAMNTIHSRRLVLMKPVRKKATIMLLCL